MQYKVRLLYVTKNADFVVSSLEHNIQYDFKYDWKYEETYVILYIVIYVECHYSICLHISNNNAVMSHFVLYKFI